MVAKVGGMPPRVGAESMQANVQLINNRNRSRMAGKQKKTRTQNKIVKKTYIRSNLGVARDNITLVNEEEKKDRRE